MAEERVRESRHSAMAQVARCLFCGSVGNGWWACGCEWGEPIIECCVELQAAARLAGVIKVVDAILKPVDAPVPIEVTAVDADGAVDAASTETDDDRLRRLRRERQQRWRAKGKADE